MTVNKYSIDTIADTIINDGVLPSNRIHIIRPLQHFRYSHSPIHIYMYIQLRKHLDAVSPISYAKKNKPHTIVSRLKHPDSIVDKLKKSAICANSEKRLHLKDIFDIIAFRIICDDVYDPMYQEFAEKLQLYSTDIKKEDFIKGTCGTELPHIRYQLALDRQGLPFCSDGRFKAEIELKTHRQHALCCAYELLVPFFTTPHKNIAPQTTDFNTFMQHVGELFKVADGYSTLNHEEITKHKEEIQTLLKKLNIFEVIAKIPTVELAGDIKGTTLYSLLNRSHYSAALKCSSLSMTRDLFDLYHMSNASVDRLKLIEANRYKDAVLVLGVNLNNISHTFPHLLNSTSSFTAYLKELF